MGTNYYHVRTLCVHCGNSERVHIGKSSGGWTFSFHGTDSIRSWKDWRSVLEAGGSIEDEYGRAVSYGEFVDLVNKKKDEPRNHTLYCRQDPYEFDKVWLDDEGNSFSGRDFS